MSDSAILKMYSGLPPHIERAPGGYSMMPRQVIRDEGLSQGEKVLLAAIIGMCYGDERRINATIDEIAGQAGMSVNSVRRFLPALIKAQLITRRPDPERIGGPWLTVVTCDPKGFQLSNTPENWRVKRVVDNRTPPTPEVRTPLPQKCAPPYADLGGGHYRQHSLTFSQQGGEEKPAPPISDAPLSPKDPEADRVCNLAATIGGDVSWALWASRQLAFPQMTPAILEAALWEGSNCGKVNQTYIGRIALRFSKDGIPEVKSNVRPGGEVPYQSGAKVYGAKSCVELEAEARRRREAASVGGEPLVPFLRRAGNAASVPPDVSR